MLKSLAGSGGNTIGGGAGLLVTGGVVVRTVARDGERAVRDDDEVLREIGCLLVVAGGVGR